VDNVGGATVGLRMEKSEKREFGGVRLKLGNFKKRWVSWGGHNVGSCHEKGTNERRGGEWGEKSAGMLKGHKQQHC